MTVHESISSSRVAPDYLRPKVDSSLQAGAKRIGADPFKRVLDILGAAIGLVILSPVLVLVGLIISLESKGWPIFSQRRSGLGGGEFVIYKFRSMRVCEDGDTIEQVALDDERVTKFGRFIRRSSLDELPQLWNILKGEMSLVGPRPHAVAHDIQYAVVLPDYNSRFLTKPGLTGLAQVTGFRGRTAETRDMAARVAKDLEYIRRWSFWLDVKILLQTVLVFAFHPMAY
jgi:lipopolysaccharide/colanic/teichoic acid biosynthesis glycosyltransferase